MISKPRCVVVDDDPDYLDRVKRLFITSCLDYDIVPFSNSVEAVEFIRQRRVDLILTAYLLPQIDGLQFISTVRSMNAHVPILMLSGVPIKAAALARGATGFVAKGALWTHLAAIVRQLHRPPRKLAAA